MVQNEHINQSKSLKDINLLDFRIARYAEEANKKRVNAVFNARAWERTIRRLN